MTTVNKKALITRNGIKIFGDPVAAEDFLEGVYENLLNKGAIVTDAADKIQEKSDPDGEPGEPGEPEKKEPKRGRPAGAQK